VGEEFESTTGLGEPDVGKDARGGLAFSMGNEWMRWLRDGQRGRLAWIYGSGDDSWEGSRLDDKGGDGVLELVDAVRARHVTPVISIYYNVVAEPYFVGFRSA